jgi:hypothetical protein
LSTLRKTSALNDRLAPGQAKPYFESLGYAFPAEVNPADFLLDIIGGEAPCDGNPALTPADLPRKWMEDAAFKVAPGGKVICAPLCIIFP